MDNDDGWDACKLASEVGALCNSNFYVPPLRSNDTVYFFSTPSECACTLLMYQALSACETCTYAHEAVAVARAGADRQYGQAKVGEGLCRGRRTRTTAQRRTMTARTEACSSSCPTRSRCPSGPCPTRRQTALGTRRSRKTPSSSRTRRAQEMAAVARALLLVEVRADALAATAPLD